MTDYERLVDAEARELYFNWKYQRQVNGNEAASAWVKAALKVSEKRYGKQVSDAMRSIRESDSEVDTRWDLSRVAGWHQHERLPDNQVEPEAASAEGSGGRKARKGRKARV